MKTFNYKPARYSVIRIEQAKQRALTGQSWSTTKIKEGVKMDWTGDDEEMLCTLIDSWDESTGHEGLNTLIDTHEFSHGCHFENSGLKKALDTIVFYPEGRFLAEPQVEIFSIEYNYQLGPGTIRYATNLHRPEDIGMGFLLERGYKGRTVIKKSEVGYYE